MENTDSNSAGDMSIRDLSNSINERFNMVFAEFEKVHKHILALTSTVFNLQQDVQEIKEELHGQEEQLNEIQHTLETLSNAFDKDAVTLVKHERRISVLEGKNPTLSTTN